MFDLLAVAFQADITRVFSFMMARESARPDVSAAGRRPRRTTGCRTTRETRPRRWPGSRRSTPITSDLFGRFLRRLKTKPDGDGTMLDHSMVLYGSGMGNANVHGHVDLPYLVAGTGSGTITGGRHIKARAHDPSGNLLLSVVDKFGIAKDTVGYSTGRVDL